IIEHQKYVFDSFWNRAIPAEHRIREIEEGIIPNIIEIIQDSARAQEIYLNIVNDAAEEILLIFPTTNAFLRQDKIGALQLTEQAAKERNVKVRILMPLLDSLTEHTVRNLRQEKQQQQPQKDNLKSNIEIRYIEQISEAKATILIVDKKISLVMEIRDDAKTTFYEAIGLSTYSNSQAGVLSYVSIFENLWIQTELYQQVRETNKRLEGANEQLRVHGKMQREFIDIAAHELRTPIQPILSLTEVISSRIKDTEEAELLKVVSRNAKRLQQLTEDVLDVTRIESNSLLLNKEQFDLNEVITNGINDVIANAGTFSVKKKENIKLFYEAINKTVIVEADKARISQVISNLLNNAVKFTSEEEGGGTISVTLEEHKNDYNNKREVIVKIKDTGIGIASEIMPRLFKVHYKVREMGYWIRVVYI
ncbi:MAG: HAMP domain-containing histidine kinase, partial [Nitrososphaeraceae archaeon]|nr:HAMP domain-containing histidine kinase [Nitrososphaeraceae archaeon]